MKQTKAIAVGGNSSSKQKVAVAPTGINIGNKYEIMTDTSKDRMDAFN